MTGNYTEYGSKSTLYTERFAIFNQLREDRELCDVTLIADGKRLKVHKLVLSSGSPYFRKMFTSSMLETNLEEICIPDINYETMEHVIEFLYTSRVKLTTENAQDILIAANFLQIVSLVELTGRYAVKQIDATNCFSMRDLLITTNCHGDILARSNEYINDHFQQICQNESFLQLDINEVVELLSSTELCYTSEEDVCLSAIRWLMTSNDRKKYSQQIFNCIRLPLLSYNFKSEHIDNNPLFNNNTVNRNIEPSDTSRVLKTSLLALNSVDGQYSLNVYNSSTKTWTKWMDVEDKIYRFIASNSDYLVLSGPQETPYEKFFFDVLNFKTKEWTSMPMLQGSVERNNFVAVEIIGCKLYVFRRKEILKKCILNVAILDIKQGRCIDEFEMTSVDRFSWPSFINVGKFIYSKTTSIIRKLDTETHTWEDVTVMTNRGGHCGKTAYKGNVYFTGGLYRSLKPENSFDVYDPVKNEIKELSPLIEKKDCYLCRLKATSDGIYAFRSFKVAPNEYSLEFDFYDVENDEWRCEGRVPDRLKTSLLCIVPMFCIVPNLQK